MLDLIISYINLLILSISYIVKKFAYLPPEPPKYIILKEKLNHKGKKEEKEDILFLMKLEGENSCYQKLRPKSLNIEYSKIIKDDNCLPILKISPISSHPYCIIYCQGNSGDLGTSLFECFEISIKCNCLIVTFEYPGYGICKNDEITEHEFFKRIKIVYYYIINVLNYKPNQIFLYGFSLGTGIAFDFACKKEFPVAGLILQSPFLSIIRTRYDIKKTKYFDLFNNCDKAKNLCRKTLFLHGNCDTIVPYIHGRILAKLIPKIYFYDFLTINNANHNNLLKKNKIVFEYINKFIFDCIESNTITDYDEKYINANTSINIDNNEDIRKLNDYNSFMKNVNNEFKKNEENTKKEIFLKEQNEFKKKIKPNSYINYPTVYNRKLKSNIGNDKNNIQKENNFKETNCDNHNLNLRNSYYNKYEKYKENQNYKYIPIIKQKNSNFSQNYYYVNIGTYNKNNNFVFYKKDCKNINNVNNNIKNLKIENSLSSINSSTNNINNSK